MVVDSNRWDSYDSKAIQPNLQVCPDFGSGWISLYDVIQRNGTYFLNVYRLLVAFEQIVATVLPKSDGGATAGLEILSQPSFSALLAGAGQITSQPIIDAARIDEEIFLIELDANQLDLEGTADRIRAIRQYITQNPTIDFRGDEHLRHDIRVLRETLLDELKRRWIFIPDREIYRKYFNKSFGDDVDNAFPDARLDTASAANSYIYGEPTACVFHCMRTAEFGLRGLAKRIMPRLRAEKLEWGAIIRELRKQIEELNQPGRKKIAPRRKQRVDFYSAALDQCGYFKSIRDDTMHPRPIRYEAGDALKALTHVEEFMKLLAKNGIKLASKI